MSKVLEGLDFVHVKIGPPEACDALVMVQDRLAGRSPAEIAEEIVDITQVFPVARRPTGLVVGVEIVGQVLPLAAPSRLYQFLPVVLFLDLFTTICRYP